MRLPMTVLALITMFATGSAAQQGAPLKSCPLLDLADAAVLTGPGVEFYSGNESAGQAGQKTSLCFFGVGHGRSLTVKTGPSMAKDAAAYRAMYEPLRKISNETLEPGLGEYATSKLEDGTAEITVVKGTLVLSLELKGDDLTPADLEKLRAATRKVLPKI